MRSISKLNIQLPQVAVAWRGVCPSCGMEVIAASELSDPDSVTEVYPIPCPNGCMADTDMWLIPAEEY